MPLRPYDIARNRLVALRLSGLVKSGPADEQTMVGAECPHLRQDQGGAKISAFPTSENRDGES